MGVREIGQSSLSGPPSFDWIGFKIGGIDMKSRLLLPLVLVTSSLALSCDLVAEPKDVGDEPSLTSPVGQGAQALSLPSCGSQSLFATHSPVAQADIRGISPMGSLEPPVHT